MTLIVEIGQAGRYRARDILKKFGRIQAEGYTHGSTMWAFSLSTKVPADVIRDALWEEFASVFVGTRKEYEESTW